MVTTLQYLIANNRELLPHIEMSAIKLIQKNYVLPGRVLTLSDMKGWNIRKISEYIPPVRAGELQESTAIPTTEVLRSRLAEVAPKEIGSAYEISDRRYTTDPEDILVDTVKFLARAIGERIEQDLYSTLNSAILRVIDNKTQNYEFKDTVAATTVMQQHFDGVSQLHHVFHPYQLYPIIGNMVKVTDATTGQAAMMNGGATQAQLYNSPVGTLVTGTMHPRRVIIKLHIAGDGGNFRLQVGDGNVIGVNITDEINYSATASAIDGDIKTALEALTFPGNGTWSVTGSSLDDITVTPPPNLYLDDFSQLRVANEYNEKATINHYFDSTTQKSSYDKITNPATGVFDMNGSQLGVVVRERSATAKVYSFFGDTIVRDVRESVKVHSNLELHDGRTTRYAMYTKYGVAPWRAYRGIATETKADSPYAVG